MHALKTVCAALLVSAGPLCADELSLDQVSGYFNSLESAVTKFEQLNDDGSVSTGTLYIKRPGKMRFEYDPPNSAVVVAGSQTVVIFDKKSNQPAETYPLRRTPLSIILDDRVDLSRAKMVTGKSYDGNVTYVTAQDPDNPEYGSIRLAFTDAPVALRQWVIEDSTGGQTRVMLDGFKEQSLPNRLFNVGSPGAAGNSLR